MVICQGLQTNTWSNQELAPATWAPKSELTEYDDSILTIGIVRLLTAEWSLQFRQVYGGCFASDGTDNFFCHRVGSTELLRAMHVPGKWNVLFPIKKKNLWHHCLAEAINTTAIVPHG